MSSFKASKGNISRVKHLQRAHFKNLCEMKRFADKQKILSKDQRRSMFLINKEIQEVQKTLMEIKLISGYCHQAYTAHLRSSNLPNTAGDHESDLSEVSETVDTNACKKLSSNSIHLTKTKNCASPYERLKNGLGENIKCDCFDVSSSRFDTSELSSSEKVEGDAHPLKTSQATHDTKTDLKNSSSSPTRFTRHRRATPVHQKTDLRKCPTLVTMTLSREWKNSKTLSRHIQYQDTKSNARSHISKAAMKRGLDLLIKEYNDPQNLELLNKRKQRVLKDKVSDFVSQLSESKCKAAYV